ncbi:CHAT domain-containing protein [Nodosilinea sp. AN01ver1]|uniref:CHAT domain-containing protein n=1 Tax=Nodosilinea sp. AN01ver1 TaxID=3423362 RepID=UPI003D321DA6
MDEQRMQAYVKLIEKLLACPLGQEVEIFQANEELVDAELPGAMKEYANYLESQGNRNVEWLRGVAAQLEQVIGVETVNANTEDEEQFLIETLQFLIGSQGNPKQVYPIWEQQKEKFTPVLLNILPSVASRLLTQNTEQQKISIAFAFSLFGYLLQQFPIGNRWLNLELAISAYQIVLSVITKTAMPVERSQIMTNLGIVYYWRTQGDKAQNIEVAIALYQEALSIITKTAMPTEWVMVMVNLANAYRDRLKGNKAENIEDAIAAYQQALSVITKANHPFEWATAMMNLGNAYYFRIRGDKAENIEDAIAAWQQTLSVMTKANHSSEWATAMMNLANAYCARIRGDKAQDFEDAIDIYQQVLSVRTKEAMPFEWGQVMSNLALTYFERIRGDKAQNIEDAITACQQTLSVITKANYPFEWATTMNNLALAYRSRIRGDEGQNIEDAIVAYQQTLSVRTKAAMPFEWAQIMNNLAIAYYLRLRGSKAKNVEDAITAYQASLGVFETEVFPNDCRRAARVLANIYSDQRRWQDAVPIYQQALCASEILYQGANLLDSKTNELSMAVDLPRRAAYAMARTANLQDAVTTLEQGRARGLSESLDRDRSDLTQLQQIAPDLYNRYQDITKQLRNLESRQRDRMISSDRYSLTPETLRETAIDLRYQLTTLIQDIRQIPGYEKFLTLPTFEEVHQAASSDQPLVYLVTTLVGSLAVIVTPENIQSIWLDDLTETILREILYGSVDNPKLSRWFGSYQNFRDDSKANYFQWCEEIDRATRQLWEPLMAPLIQYLTDHNFQQATLIPTGLLSFLPLHAAWTEDPSTPNGKRYALDSIHFTYAPNAKSLTAATAIAHQIDTQAMLAIDNPRNDLPNSEREVNSAISSFLPQATIFRHHRATTTAVKTALPQAAITHFSCHGTANLNEPLNSGLAMSDGLLTLKDIFALNLAESGGLRLAILSACETGIQGLENADEAVSLPTGLLQAGVAAVIASLWAVDDYSTRILLTRFYDLWRKEHLKPSEALRQAQLWVRDTTSQQKAKYFQETNPDLFQSLILLPSNHFAHPFHWAAFSYTGV